MMLTLRCQKEKDEFYKGGAHAGYIILAEPIGKETTLNNYDGQSLMVRPAEWYETIFRDLGLDIVSKKFYKSYMANDNLSDQR